MISRARACWWTGPLRSAVRREHEANKALQNPVRCWTKPSLCEVHEVPMSVERSPAAFGDMRGWIAALREKGELHEIDAEIDWNIEIGTVMRLAQGAGDGPALLFNNIKDYNLADSRCRRIFGCSLSSYRRVAMMLGMEPGTHPRELVKIGRNILNGTIPPRTVATGPVKE